MLLFIAAYQDRVSWGKAQFPLYNSFMHSITLATTHHDPQGRLYGQLRRLLPKLTQHFAALVVNAGPDVHSQTLTLLQTAGAHVDLEERAIATDGVPLLGATRRSVVQSALRCDTRLILYCDCDRILHWLDRYPEELATLLPRLAEVDFTILGRTQRAFASHPRIQTQTEQIINELYVTRSGRAWDVTAAARGMSRAAAQALVEHSTDDTLGVDATWPLLIQHLGIFTMTEIKTEGLEFETADQYPDEVAAAGSVDAWKAQLDADPRRWAFRLNVARTEVEAMLPYQQK